MLVQLQLQNGFLKTGALGPFSLIPPGTVYDSGGSVQATIIIGKVYQAVLGGNEVGFDSGSTHFSGGPSVIFTADATLAIFSDAANVPGVPFTGALYQLT